MVTDLVVGCSSSSPQNFYSAGCTIFFLADDGVHGRQLYTSDGNTVTQLTSNDSNQPVNDGSRFFTLNGKFYYLCLDSAANGGGYAIFTSDGTTAGTQRVYHFAGGNNYSSPIQLGANIVFYANDGTNGSGLYSFDGLNAPSLIANVSDYENAVVSGGNLFWHSIDGGNGQELWVSDGATAHLVKDINPGSYDSSPANIVSLGNGSVVFTAFNPTTGNEVYISDGTTGGSHMVSDLVVGGLSSAPQNLYVAGGKIFFLADDGVHGRQLYTSDGNTVTQLTSNDSNQPYNDGGRFFTLNGQFYYMGYDSAANGNGFAIFTSDGTVAGTQRVYHFANGNSYSSPIQLGANIEFYANDGTHGTGLYSFDGTHAPSLIANVSDYENAVISGGNLFWRSSDGGNGYELWVSNGTGGGTSLVKDIKPGGNWSYPDHITSLGNGSVVFTADDGTHGSELWVSNGQSAGTFMMSDLFPGGSSNPDHLTRVGSQVFFTANYFSSTDGGAHGVELFVTDGTAAGTKLVHEITPGSDGTSFDRFFSFGGKLYFTAYDAAHGGWRDFVTDGSDAGTHAITPGDGSSTGDGGNFIAANATHFFFTGDSGLFYSDGTDAGTVNIGSCRGYDASYATYNNGHLLYRTYDDTNGYELWTTDGTTAGTHRLTDTLIPNSSDATSFTFSGGKVYFYANAGVHGANELFVTDGPTTTLLNDFNGAGGTSYGANFAFGGKYYYTAYDPANGGWHTYVTSGTVASTHILPPGDGSATA